MPGILQRVGAGPLQLWAELLKEKRVKAQTIAEVTELLSAIDHALYAPGAVPTEKLETMNRNAARIIAELSKR